MKKHIIAISIKLLSLLPLNAVRAIGKLIGFIMLNFSKRSSARLRHNLLITGLATPETIDAMAKKSAQAFGMTLAESILIAWRKDPKYIQSLCDVDDESFADIHKVLDNGEKVMFLTPHMGNFDLCFKCMIYRLPTDVTILYKPNKDPILNQIMLDGRIEVNVHPEPTTARGVRNLIRHFQAGGDIGILPDNVAAAGSGEWVKFFGQDVYAATLTAKIYQQYQPTTVILRSIRTKNGFKMSLVPFKPSSNDTHAIMQELYQVTESIILEAPEQYYWSYDRFRNVNNSKPKPQEG